VNWTLVGAVLLCTAGLLVLGVLGLRLWLDARALAREVDGAVSALRRAGEADEIVGTALYLASDASSYTTGTALNVDGGYLS